MSKNSPLATPENSVFLSAFCSSTDGVYVLHLGKKHSVNYRHFAPLLSWRVGAPCPSIIHYVHDKGGNHHVTKTKHQPNREID